MQLSLVTYGLFAWLAAKASATALTYKLLANEEACFYTLPERQGQKIAFYFAVSFPALCGRVHRCHG